MAGRLDINKELDRVISYYAQSFVFYKDANTAAMTGNLYFKKGDAVMAMKYIKQALEISPKCIPAYYFLGLYYYSIKDLDKARENAMVVLKYDSNNMDAINLLNQIRGN
jgi:tetratricopeptide (TPR) repeat protein